MARTVVDKSHEVPSSTKARILAAAERIFAARGFEGASTREIAAASEANISSLHYHWESKETLYYAVFERIHDQLLEVVRTSIHSSAALRPRLRRHIIGLVHGLIRNASSKA